MIIMMNSEKKRFEKMASIYIFDRQDGCGKKNTDWESIIENKHDLNRNEMF